MRSAISTPHPPPGSQCGVCIVITRFITSYLGLVIVWEGPMLRHICEMKEERYWCFYTRKAHHINAEAGKILFGAICFNIKYATVSNLWQTVLFASAHWVTHVLYGVKLLFTIDQFWVFFATENMKQHVTSSGAGTSILRCYEGL